MTSITAWRVGALTVLAACACAAHARDFVTLAPDVCLPVERGIALPAEMEPYRPSVRVCPLMAGASTGATPAKVRLLSVFTEDHYQALPADAPWQDFPRPILVDESGRCLGRIAHLFPVDPPEQLVITAGRWQRGIPRELRFEVRSPAVGGNFKPPSLHWNERSRSYVSSSQAPSPSAKNKQPPQDKTSCPST